MRRNFPSLGVLKCVSNEKFMISQLFVEECGIWLNQSIGSLVKVWTKSQEMTSLVGTSIVLQAILKELKWSLARVFLSLLNLGRNSLAPLGIAPRFFLN